MDTQVDPVPPTGPVAASSEQHPALPSLASPVATTLVGPATLGGAPGQGPAIMDGALRELGAMVERESSFVDLVTAETGKVVIGQSYMIERILIGLLTGGHCLIEGVPGLAKTLTVKTLSQTIHASFQRIQFTPDLLPADITGTTIYNMQTATFTQKKGPLFANLVLADEINRAPAKVQSALLEAMQERQVSIGGQTFPLPKPFLVLATQNPIEQEGTYRLPEAQIDRFFMKLVVGYPSEAEELAILERMATTQEAPKVRRILTLEGIQRARALVDEIHLDPRLSAYIVRLVGQVVRVSIESLRIIKNLPRFLP